MISTRKAVAMDFEFTYRAKELGYRAYVEKIWGKWDDSWQRAEHKKDFDSGSLGIVVYDGADAGYLNILKGQEAIHLADILILPEFQSKGIGTQIIQALLAEARSKGLPLELGVFKINISALKLYKTLGFSQVSENDTHIAMRAV